MYDFLIVGAGLFGSVAARTLTDSGYHCLVIDKRGHIGGNCYTRNEGGINVHKYGAHIFHTNDDKIWDFVNKFAKFNHYVNRPKVYHSGRILSFPINLMTLHQLWGVSSPEEAEEKLRSKRIHFDKPKNLEEWILSQVGEEIYEIFIKGYTTKQWGTDPKNLPASIIKRLPIRTTFDDNYFNDRYQGIPIGGYTSMFENILNGIEVRTGIDYFLSKDYFNGLSRQVIYTGEIDRFFDFKFGKLSYRSLRFEDSILDIKDFQGNAVINYTEASIPYTRIIEHKHFEFGKQEHTVITKEYPADYVEGSIPYYPVNDSINEFMYKKYSELKKDNPNIHFGGRLAEYKYYDMHQVIGSALVKTEEIIKKTRNR